MALITLNPKISQLFAPADKLVVKASVVLDIVREESRMPLQFRSRRILCWYYLADSQLPVILGIPSK